MFPVRLTSHWSCLGHVSGPFEEALVFLSHVSRPLDEPLVMLGHVSGPFDEALVF